MPAPPESTWSTNGAARGNLFIDADPDLHEDRSTTTSGTVRRRRGLVVPIEEPTATRAQNTERFARARPGTAGAIRRVREQAAGADRAAKRLLTPLLSQPYRALIALVATVALLLTVSWLGLSLRSTTAERDHARREQQASVAMLGAAGARLRVLTTQRDRAIGAARAARREQATASDAARTRRTRAGEAMHWLAQAPRANRRRRSHR